MSLRFKSKKTKFVIGGVLITFVIGYLIYAGVRDTRMYYLTPSEIIEMGEEARNTGIRLGGIVEAGSISWNEQELLLAFRVIDGESSIPVVYQGVVPDTFENGVEIVVEGKYTDDGLFKAELLLPKCPSKYEPAS